ncbi:MAG: hypothetical protein ACK4UV_06095 [Ignavibacterium sp.]
MEFHLKNNAFYQNLVGKDSFENWNDLPVLTKKDLQKPLKDRLSKGYSEKTVFVNKTSGSSGDPFVFAKDKEVVEVKTKPYSNPYLTGIGLGLVLLAAFVIMGRGLGASGAMSTLVAVGVNTVAPEHTQSNSFYSEYLGDGTTSPLKDWLVFEVLGVLA